jgi:DNA-binding response OmpR family regulator
MGRNVKQHPLTSKTDAILFVGEDVEANAVWQCVLQQCRFMTYVTNNFATIVPILSEQQVSIVILDDVNITSLPDMYQIVYTTHSEVAVPILMLGNSHQESDILNAYKHGIAEYIPKPVSPMVLLAKVRSWLTHTRIAPVSRFKLLDRYGFRLDPIHRQLTSNQGHELSLTNLEFQLLYLLLSNGGAIVRTDYIIEYIWGTNGDQVLLKNLIYRLRQKIEQDSSHPCYIQTIPHLGYRFGPVTHAVSKSHNLAT